MLLTHLHYDHVLGLPFFSPLRDPGAVLDVYGPSQEGGSLHDVLSGMVAPPFFPISMADFQGELRCHDLDGSAEFAVGGIQVKARPISHIGHTLGFRIEADGRSVAYISDHQAPLDLRTVDKQRPRTVRGRRPGDARRPVHGRGVRRPCPTGVIRRRPTPSGWPSSRGPGGCACSTTTRPTPTTRSTGCSATRGGSPPNTAWTR